MTRFTPCATSSPRLPTTTHKCVPSAHTLTYTQRDTSIAGAHLAPTEGVLGALTIEDAFYRMCRIFAETSDCRREVRT